MTADIFPFAETEPAILTNRDRLAAYSVAFKVSHDGISFVRGFSHTCPETTTDQSPFDAMASIGSNSVLL